MLNNKADYFYLMRTDFTCSDKISVLNWREVRTLRRLF